MADVDHAEEFRRRFRQAQLQHPHVASTLEVLEIADRPAALEEWLAGLPCPDWPPLASVPGVSFRLLSQAALSLATIHGAGLVHGHLQDESLLLTADGILKMCGVGEPTWLTVPPYAADATPVDDLIALGSIAAGWCSPQTVRKGAK